MVYFGERGTGGRTGALAILARATRDAPFNGDLAATIAAAFDLLQACFVAGGTLFLAGNGGSMADALHISGELDKSFKLPRSIPAPLQARLAAQPDGQALAQALQGGLPAIVLGANPTLASAVANDCPLPNMGLAQELYALGRRGDILLGISTSGNAANVFYAAQVARALEMPVLALTGEGGGKLAAYADLALRAPARATDHVQNLHILIYHLLCEMLETAFFGEEG